MIGFQVQWFVLAFLLFHTVHGTTSTTGSYTDDKFMTRAVHNSFRSILDNFSQTADPFSPGNITLALPDSSYELYNVVISGLSDCKIVYVSIDDTDSTFIVNTLCPQFILESDFVGEGTLAGLAVDGQGVGRITADYKLVNWEGTYTITTSDDDQEQYIYATEYTVDVIYIERMSYEILSMVDKSQTDVDQLNEYLSENWSEVTTYTEPTFIEDFIKPVVALYNDAIKTKFSLDDMLALGNE